jgi:oligopeptide transport system ATP-binding protein
MAHLPAGCPFSERCTFVMDRCATERPALVPAGVGLSKPQGGQEVPLVLRACHREVIEVAPVAEALLHE